MYWQYHSKDPSLQIESETAGFGAKGGQAGPSSVVKSTKPKGKGRGAAAATDIEGVLLGGSGLFCEGASMAATWHLDMADMPAEYSLLHTTQHDAEVASCCSHLFGLSTHTSGTVSARHLLLPFPIPPRPHQRR